MDQIKIGKLIAECRREKQLTQAQLAERLNITDKAVSKWERGIALPDSSIMLEVCDILGISATELLCGERINMENYSGETEKKLLEMVKEKEEKDRQLLTLEWAIGILSLCVLLLPVLIGALAPISEEWVRIVVVFSGFLPAFVGFFFALKIEQIAGYYACGECGHRYVPTFKAVNLAPHMGRTRRMKCPKCGKKSWQKKVIGKE
jgi:transcriptional regulator with XRE-family HTH domain/DNA-directed RNA polymerase subunit RPC12/RpoP